MRLGKSLAAVTSAVNRHHMPGLPLESSSAPGPEVHPTPLPKGKPSKLAKRPWMTFDMNKVTTRSRSPMGVTFGVDQYVTPDFCQAW